ncbi:MAG: hypothetical protein ACOY94_15425 [Bacillota bacterium]
MERRWIWWIIAALALTAAAGGVRWPSPGPGRSGDEGAMRAAAVAATAGTGCALLAELEPVELYARPAGGVPIRAGTGYRHPETDRVMAPARRLITPLAPGPLGVHWESGNRTATLLVEGNVLSIHFPEGQNRSTIAVMNGEVVGAESVLCEERLYAPLRLMADGLNLRYRWRDVHSILVEGR